MIRKLTLMRHAKAGDSAGSDFERTLTARGRADAAAVSTILATAGIDYALVSAAARTRETFEALHLKVPAEFQKALYLGGEDILVQRIGEAPQECQHLLVVGHAPEIPELASQLTYWATVNNPTHDESDQLRCGFSTANYATFGIESTWQQLADDLLELHPVTGVTVLGGSALVC